MATLLVTRNYADGEILTQADLDAFLDDIETFVNITKLNDDNLQNNGITGSLKLVNATVTNAKLASDSVTTTKILDQNVTTDKIADDAVTEAKLALLSVGTPELIDASVTTPKIADANVTASKLSTDAIALVLPPGVILPYGSTGGPTGFLPCDGQSYLNSAYPALFAAIGTAYGSADGTHFNVPDLRGQFLRGVDGTAGVDPDKAGRTALKTGGNIGNNVGSAQVDGFKSHSHLGVANIVDPPGGLGPPYISFQSSAISASTSNVVSVNSAVTIGSTGGNETRPANVYVYYIIKT